MTDDDALRDGLGRMLADGIETHWEARAYESEQVFSIVTRLQGLAPDDYKQKLIVGGFTDHPYGDEDDGLSQDCSTCMYYLKHRRFCELPELNIPVEPRWSCVLWRI